MAELMNVPCSSHEIEEPTGTYNGHDPHIPHSEEKLKARIVSSFLFLVGAHW